MPSAGTQFTYAFRRLRRSPMFTALTLLTLGIGVGANTAMFSVVYGILLKPLPYHDADRLVAIWEKAPGVGIDDLNASPATYFTFREEGRSFEDVGIWQGDSVSVTGIGEPEQVAALDVSDGTLPILGVQPMRGRWFSRKDDSPGSPETVLLAYGYWQRKFGGDPSVIGRRIVIDAKAREVIGIMPRNFQFLNRKADLILPLRLDRNKAYVGNFSYQTLAKLKPGVTIAQASADVARMLPLMLRKFPAAPGLSLKTFEAARLSPNLRFLQQDVVGDIGKVLWLLLGTVGIVLFIACANVANLLLVRAEGRQQELAIRGALGASWLDIARELLLESVTLGLVGGAVGLGLAYSGLRLLIALGPSNLPRLADISISSTVLLFTIAISLLAGVLFGLAPVFKYATPRLGTALREGGRTSSDARERHQARSALVIVQVALALVLLIASGLMIRTVRELARVQPGFTSPDRILTMRVSIPEAQVPNLDQVVRMENNMVQKIGAIQGVSSVALSNSITMSGSNSNDLIFAEGRPVPEGTLPPIRRFKFISPDLFKAMGNPLLSGRDFTWTDIYERRNVVLISENFAREYWGQPSAALGKRIRENPKAPWREIIGVVGNERDDGVSQKAPSLVYWPLAVNNFWTEPLRVERTVTFAIRSERTGSAGFLSEVRQAIWSVNPDVPIADVRTVAEIYSRSMARTSFLLIMLGIAAGMALLLGLVGIYGVISYSVSQRTREIGIRMALGAQQGQVRQMFIRHGLMLTGAGVAGGLAVAMVLTRLMSALLFQVSPLDPVTYAAVPLVLLTAALLASYVPARRATTIDPADALRTE